MAHRLPSILHLLPCVAMAAAAGPLAPNASAQETTADRPLRIIVVPDTTPGGRSELSRVAADRVVELLLAKGHTVLDFQAAQALARKVDQSIGATAAREGLQSADVHLAERALGDVVVRVRLHPEFQRKAQGRYRVRDTLHVSMTLVADPQLHGSPNASLEGQSVESPLDAHKQAIQKAFDPSSELPNLLTERLAKLRAEERAKGAIYRVTIRTAGVDSAWLESASDGVAELDGVTPDSVRLQFGSKSQVEMTLRFRATPRDLRARLAKWARTRAAESVEDAAAGTPAPGISMRSNGRHLEMTIEKRERSPEDEEAALQAMIDAAVERLHTANAQALDELLVTTLPAELDVDLAAAPASTAEPAQDSPPPTRPKPKPTPPTAIAPEPDTDPRPPLILPDAPVTKVAGASRAFELARARQNFATNLRKVAADRALLANVPSPETETEPQPLQVDGNRFPDLAAARTHLAKLNQEFFATPVGEFAQSLGRRVAASLAELQAKRAQDAKRTAGESSAEEPARPANPAATSDPAQPEPTAQVIGPSADAPSTLVAAEHLSALTRDEGPVELDTAKALEAATAAEAGVRGAMVLTDLRAAEDNQLELSVSLVDLETGATTRDFTMIAGDLANRIRRRLRGE